MWLFGVATPTTPGFSDKFPLDEDSSARSGPSCGAPPAVHCTGAGFFTIQETGCASTQQGFPEIYFSQQPKTVGIRVSRGDVDLLSATLEPTYVTSAQTCPNTCGYATAELDVDR